MTKKWDWDRALELWSVLDERSLGDEDDDATEESGNGKSTTSEFGLERVVQDEPVD